MIRILLLFSLGMLCAFSSKSQPFDVVLNTPQQGNVTVQARNSIKLDRGFSYTPNGGQFLTQIVNPVVTGIVSYDQAIDPSAYSINTLLNVGKTPGELNVSGIASYTVPLDLPKGPAGLQPNLNLNYTSDFNDGLIGVGWNLGGLSEISRVGKEIYFDTLSTPVMGDLTDRFVLDGNRMIVTSGSYGADLSVYGTELEEFSKITARGGAGKGPLYFEVRTKSGLICEYGKTSDSKILRDDTDSTCVIIWKINKITDRYGNYINLSYFKSDDERPILLIAYGAVGKAPVAEVNFRYKQRSDISTYVYGGKEFTRNILLDNVEMKNNGQTYKKYEMKYMLDNYTQLQKITEYNSQNQALNPTVFTYTKQTQQLSTSVSYTNSNVERFFNGDFNGDGYTDFIAIPAKVPLYGQIMNHYPDYTTSDKWKLFLGSPTGQMISTQVEGYLNPYFKEFLAADMNGDGLDDLIQINRNKIQYYCSNGTNLSEININISRDTSGDQVNIVDYNGDGVLEILISNDYSYNLYNISGELICGNYPFPYGKTLAPLYGLEGNKIIDFDGDGCSDVLSLSASGYKIYEFKGPQNTLILKPWSGSSGSNLKDSHNIILNDFNGDGITDIIRFGGPINSRWSLLCWTKDGFKEHEIFGFSQFNLYPYNNQLHSCDINGDGLNDIILWGNGKDINNSKNRITIAINKGNGYEFDFTECISPINFDIGLVDYEFDPNCNDRNETWEVHYRTLFSYFGDYNGDGRKDFFYKDADGDSRVFSFYNSTTPSNLLNEIIDGFGAKTQIIYKPMSDVNVYTRGSGATYPLRDFSSGMQLVRQVDTDDGVGGSFTTTYKYEGAKIHLKGKGFLGFTKTIRTNEDTGIFTENNYTFDSPYYYPKLASSYTKRGSTAISTLVNYWDVSAFAESNRIFPYISSSTKTDNLKNLSVTSSIAYPTSNLYGNPTSTTVSYSSGPTKTTSFLYADERVSDWLIGRPTTITETSTSGSDTQTFTTLRIYYPNNNSPDFDQYNVGDGSFWKVNHDYDAFGNLSAEMKLATGLTTATKTTYEYDVNGVNLLKVTDKIGNPTTYAWNAQTGLLDNQTDPFGNKTTYVYSNDQLISIRPDGGIRTDFYRSFNVTGGPANARYQVEKTGFDDGSYVRVWYDRLGRELRTETKKYGGGLVKVDKQYNLKGEVSQYSEPYTGTTPPWNIVVNDDFGRITQLDPVFGPTTDYGYPTGTAKTTRTVNSRSYYSIENAAGQIIETKDPGGVITNTYWPNGLLKSTMAPGTISTTYNYDKNGNRLSINDPSAGIQVNSWYGTGQMKTYKNAKLETTIYNYTTDSKVLLKNYVSPEGTTSFTYYSNGLVNTVTSPGYNAGQPVTRSYTYDKGKVKTITESIAGISNVITFEYLTDGRLYRKYFNGTTNYEQYDYDPNSGYLYRIWFYGQVGPTLVWQLTEMDQYKRITKANIGNTATTWGYDANNLLSSISAPGVHVDSYTYDPLTGNLTYRKNWYQNKEENFGYDLEQLDKLTQVTGPVGQNISYTTDKIGNIFSKSDAGNYVYLPARPYAVDQVTSGQNISTSQQTNRFTAFGKVKQLTEGIRTAEFDYNLDQQRIRMVMREYGNVFKTRYYFGGSCEREEVGSTTTQYIWIGGDAYTAVAVAKKTGTGDWTIYNIFRDNLGTITHLKDATTGIVTEYSFDAWGRRRDANDWTTTLTNEPALFADRGFTGHEYLEDFKLYNMNGRLYDPVVGRFLSPDPFIQDPANTQSYNRYSYCLNNPLTLIDPSGNTWWDKFWNWMDKNQIQIGINMGPRGLTPNVSAPGPGNTRMSVGYNMQSGRVGFGNNSSGFMQFYFPQMNYDISEQNFVNKTLPNARTRNGEELRAADFLSTTNSWITGAGYVSGGIGAVQIGMLDYRSSLPLMSKIGTFSKFSSIYSKLGTASKLLGRGANWVGAPLSIGLDYRAMETGEISRSRFTYRTSGTIGSMGAGYFIGLAYGGPWGAAGGAFIGLGFVAGENIYDGSRYIWNETLWQISNFNNAIESGWYPGR